MSNEHPDQEPETKAASTMPALKGRQSLSRVRRELSEDELASPAVQRLLIEEIERLEHESIELKEYRDHFHEADKRAAILEEKSKRSIAGEIIFGTCLSAGAAALGYAPAVWKHPPTGPVAIVFGLVLIITGIISRITLTSDETQDPRENLSGRTTEASG
jgi:hypothetical protein